MDTELPLADEPAAVFARMSGLPLSTETGAVEPGWAVKAGHDAPNPGFAEAGEAIPRCRTPAARIVVHALTDEQPHNTDHPITGPQALSYTETAAIITEVTGRPVVHRAVTVPELLARLSAYPPEFAAILAALDTDIAVGAEDRVTDTVTRVTGRPARDFHTFASNEL
jgi:uncharacterized protein YbjT (DUF2867 family)